MMRLNQIFLYVIIFSIVMQSSIIFAAPDDIVSQNPKLFSFINEEDLKGKIVQDSGFISNLALLAHYMGFAWCGGTKSRYVGDDFNFRKTGTGSYTLNANYNSNDPYAEGYRANDRLEMRISDARLYMDGNTLEFGETEFSDMKPITTLTGVAKNRSDYEDTAFVNFRYWTSQTWSKTDTYNFSEHVGLKNKYKFDCLLFGTETEISLDFTAEQGWSKTTGKEIREIQEQGYTATLPPKSQRTIRLIVMKQESDVPYSINMYIEYNVTFKGFLRWSGNARVDHPTDRPTEIFKFGGNNNLNSDEDILQQYIHRDISGNSKWDWDWMMDKYGRENIKSVLSSICKKPYGSITEGKFTGINGTYVDMEASEATPLEDTYMRDVRETPAITFEDIEIQDDSLSEAIPLEDTYMRDVRGIPAITFEDIEIQDDSLLEIIAIDVISEE